MKCYITLDVGGTQIKAAAIDENACFVSDNVMTYPSLSTQDKETILGNLYNIVKESAQICAEKGYIVAGVALAFPGEFDYENGVCLIKGIAKYDCVYGCNIKEYLKKQMELDEAQGLYLQNSKIVFINDIAAFALGELNFGNAKGCTKAICLCIGTGAGSAFIDEGKLVDKAQNGAPENGYVYCAPFKDSIIDDYISKRGIERLSLKHIGKALDGKPLSELAQAQNAEALAAFAEFDENIALAISPFIKSFRPECFILGGQVAKSAELFTNGLAKACDAENCRLFIETETSRLAFLGLYSLFCK